MYALLSDFLARHLPGASAEQVSLFCSKFRLKRPERGELLLQAGDVCPYIYFVNSGILRVYMLDSNGRESTRFLITAGRFGTAFPSFTLQEPSLAYIQSTGPSEVLYISYKEFQELMDLIPGWERVYRINLEKDYIASIKRIESLIMLNASERYDQLMQHQPELIQQLPSKIIADYLGISQETLSRLKAKK